jgi:tripartite-type tricarboxylate transporter receptor subunit TctC
MTVAQAISPSIYKQLGFDPSADFSHVTLMAVVPSLLLVHPSLPVKNVQQFVALAKAKPGHLSYASTGNGTSTHMMMEMLKTMTKIDIVHIPYKGVSLAIVDQISGLVESSFGTAIGTLPFVRQGKIRALAVSTRDRFPPLPDLQTMQESGIKGFEASSWTGMSMPAGTPLEIVRKVNQELTGMLRTPGVRARLLEMGGIVVADTPEEFSAFVKRDTEQWAKVAKAANVQIN